MQKLVVFDIGGVLRDSSLVMQEGYRRGLEGFGLNLKLNSAQIWNLRGIGKYNSGELGAKAVLAITRSKQDFDSILRKSNSEEIIDGLVQKHIAPQEEEKCKRMYWVYRDFFNSPQAGEKVRIFPDAKNALELLIDNNYLLAIFTNASRVSVERDLGSLGLDKFSAIISEEDVVQKKPSGEGIVKIIEKIGADAQKTYYVGDAPTDIMAAKDAGCKSIAMLTGMGLRKNLEAEKPDLIFASLKEMSEYLATNK